MATTEERADEIAAQVMAAYDIRPTKLKHAVREAIADAAQIGLEDSLRPTEPILGRRLVVLSEPQIQLLLRALGHMSVDYELIKSTRKTLRKALK